jgi:TolB protein
VIAALAALVAGTASAGAPASAPIVFAIAAGVPDIAVRTGAGVERLTRNDWYEGLPAWSPDGTRIAYVSARHRDADIWVMNAHGSGARRVAGARYSDDLYPAWSPDGKLIAFARYGRGSGHVYVMRADGTGLRRLTDTAAGVDNTMPRFSPDGRHIVLASTRRSGAHELVRVRASDGGGATFLTRGGNTLAPDYSPDGRRLVFITYIDSSATLWTMNADGGDRRVLTRHAGRTLSLPRFSPDGRFVLYTVAKPADEQTEARLWRIAIDGTARARIGRGAEGDW